MPTDTHSIIIDSATSNRDNIGAGETVELISGKSTLPVTVSGVFNNNLDNGHGTHHFDGVLNLHRKHYSMNCTEITSLIIHGAL